MRINTGAPVPAGADAVIQVCIQCSVLNVLEIQKMYCSKPCFLVKIVSLLFNVRTVLSFFPQVEDTRLIRASEDGKTEFEIEILIAPSVGQDIRPIGSDISHGSKVLTSQSRLGAAEVGLLAAVGAVEVEVYRLPKVAVLSTGDEVLFSPPCI